jgi:hypothetical protein
VKSERETLPAHVIRAIEAGERIAEVARRSLIREAEARIDAGPLTGGVKRVIPSPNHATPYAITPRAKGRPAPSPYRSELERDYAERLELQRIAGEIAWWAYEAITFNLGGGAKFKPDFLIVGRDCKLTVAETKGPFARESSIVRIKVAAARFPFLRFLLVTRNDGHWAEKEITP